MSHIRIVSRRATEFPFPSATELSGFDKLTNYEYMRFDIKHTKMSFSSYKTILSGIFLKQKFYCLLVARQEVEVERPNSWCRFLHTHIIQYIACCSRRRRARWENSSLGVLLVQRGGRCRIGRVRRCALMRSSAIILVPTEQTFGARPNKNFPAPPTYQKATPLFSRVSLSRPIPDARTPGAQSLCPSSGIPARREVACTAQVAVVSRLCTSAAKSGEPALLPARLLIPTLKFWASHRRQTEGSDLHRDCRPLWVSLNDLAHVFALTLAENALAVSSSVACRAWTLTCAWTVSFPVKNRRSLASRQAPLYCVRYSPVH